MKDFSTEMKQQFLKKWAKPGFSLFRVAVVALGCIFILMLIVLTLRMSMLIADKIYTPAVNSISNLVKKDSSDTEIGSNQSAVIPSEPSPSPSPYIADLDTTVESNGFFKKIPQNSYGFVWVDNFETRFRDPGDLGGSTTSLIRTNNPQPNIAGFLQQNEEFYLDYELVWEQSPASLEIEPYVQFYPGKLKNVQIFINDTQVEAYGIPKTPTLLCRDYEKKKNIGSYADYVTAEECLEKSPYKTPEIYFFFKSPMQLGTGQYTITMTSTSGESIKEPLIFDVSFDQKPSYLRVPIANQRLLLGAADACVPGFFYQEDFFPVPLVEFSSPYLYYLATFPPSPDAQLENHIVFVEIEGKRFPLLLPTVLEGSSSWPSSIYIPKTMLRYSNGLSAEPKDIRDEKGQAVILNYFEVVPVSPLGEFYHRQANMWYSIGHSGCDG